MFGVTEVLVLICTFLIGAFLFVKYHFLYFKRHNVVHIKPNLIFGNLTDMVMMRNDPSAVIDELYNHKLAKNEPYVGIHVFHKPGLLIRDIELVKQVLIKDFSKFSNRYGYADVHDDPLGSNNLFFVKNPEWKAIRTKLTPVFTSGKMKQMFHLVDEIGSKLDSHLNEFILEKDNKATCREVKEICTLYTTDVIASIAYGLEANSLKNPDGDFRKNGRQIFKFTFFRSIEFLTLFFLPKLVPIVKAKLFNAEASKFLRTTIGYVMDEREKSGTFRNDLIDILVSFRKESTDKSELKFTNDMIVAQAAVFFTAGYETSSSAMSFSLYELCKQPEIQVRLRNEIKEALEKNDGKISYEIIQDMEYLNMVLQEILRMYPPLPFLDREVTLGKGEDSYSLEPFGKFKMPPGMPTIIPVHSIQRDPQYFPDPNKFDPERFSSTNKGSIKTGTYLPFGMGPHNCIGERFGLLQAKIGLVNFLKNHYVRSNEKTHKEMVLDKKALIIQAEGGIYCDVVRDPLI